MNTYSLYVNIAGDLRFIGNVSGDTVDMECRIVRDGMYVFSPRITHKGIIVDKGEDEFFTYTIVLE